MKKSWKLIKIKFTKSCYKKPSSKIENLLENLRYSIKCQKKNLSYQWQWHIIYTDMRLKEVSLLPFYHTHYSSFSFQAIWTENILATHLPRSTDLPIVARFFQKDYAGLSFNSDGNYDSIKCGDTSTFFPQLQLKSIKMRHKKAKISFNCSLKGVPTIIKYAVKIYPFLNLRFQCV